MKGFLQLEDGSCFEGELSVEGEAEAEVVFTTGMCGYYESLTDPSFAGQILVFTFPLIGNYGVADKEQWESEKIHVKGVVVSEECTAWSHYAGVCSLAEWLKAETIPLLTGVDTRALTKKLRQGGTLLGKISSKKERVVLQPSRENLVALVARKQKHVYGTGKKRVIAVDCGMKESIIRQLIRFPIEVIRVPYNYDYTNEEYDGVFLSNGPGD
ncbi:MAG: carbamoyl-phosphate synthase domain-containing protein, partial [Chlamydiales bacterium]